MRDANTKNPMVIREKDKLRGEVPARQEGRKDEVYGAYLERLDPKGNEDIQLALAQSPDPRFRAFLDRLYYGSPVWKGMKLQTIAKGCGIDLVEFQDFVTKAATQRAIAEAQLHALSVTRDMAQDARSIDDGCERCDGLGWVSAPGNLPLDTPGYKMLQEEQKAEDGTVIPAMYSRTCLKCKGSGNVRKPGDTHSRDRLLQMAKLVDIKGSGVNLTLNFGGAGHQSAVPAIADAMTLDVEAVTMGADAEDDQEDKL